MKRQERKRIRLNDNERSVPVKRRVPDPPDPPPMPTVENGKADRNSRGRFVPGNKAAAGQHQTRIQQLKNAVVECVTPEHVAAVMAALLKRAIAGDVFAARVWLDRACGRVVEIAEAEPDDTGPLFGEYR